MRDGAKREPENRSAARIGLGFDLAAMRFHDGARDRQPNSHAFTLGRDERLKQLRHDYRIDTGTGVGHADRDHVVSRGGGGYYKLAAFGGFHRLTGVAQQ